MCLTQFHCLVMYKDKLEALCVLNDKVVFQEAHTVRVGGYTEAIWIEKLSVWYTCHMHAHMHARTHIPVNFWRVPLFSDKYSNRTYL